MSTKYFEEKIFIFSYQTIRSYSNNEKRPVLTFNDLFRPSTDFLTFNGLIWPSMVFLTSKGFLKRNVHLYTVENFESWKRLYLKHTIYQRTVDSQKCKWPSMVKEHFLNKVILKQNSYFNWPSTTFYKVRGIFFQIDSTHDDLYIVDLDKLDL